MRKLSLILLALCTLSLVSVATAAQASRAAQKTSATSSRTAKALPIYTVGGVMRGSTITAELGGKGFTYQLTSAAVVGGKLQFTGVMNAKPANKVTATLASTTARSANPWPSAASGGTTPARRPSQRSNTKPEEQRPQGEVNEQTQSLHSAVSVGSGCELLYLKLQTPLQPQPVQLGVVLAHQDNQLGEEINQAICRVVWALQGKQSTESALAQLNELLVKAK